MKIRKDKTFFKNEIESDGAKYEVVPRKVKK
jgi:hypothetical protein